MQNLNEVRHKLDSAARARRLARGLGDPDRVKLLRFAEELEAQVLAMERQVAGLPSGALATQQQQQLQQQRSE